MNIKNIEHKILYDNFFHSLDIFCNKQNINYTISSDKTVFNIYGLGSTFLYVSLGKNNFVELTLKSYRCVQNTYAGVYNITGIVNYKESLLKSYDYTLFDLMNHKTFYLEA